MTKQCTNCGRRVNDLPIHFTRHYESDQFTILLCPRCSLNLLNVLFDLAPYGHYRGLLEKYGQQQPKPIERKD